MELHHCISLTSTKTAFCFHSGLQRRWVSVCKTFRYTLRAVQRAPGASREACRIPAGRPQRAVADCLASEIHILGCSMLLHVPGPGFGLVLCQFWFGNLIRTDKIRCQLARPSGQGNEGPDFGPFALAFRSKPARNRPRTVSPARGAIIEQPKVMHIRKRSPTRTCGAPTERVWQIS